ncbi:hypothetical protein [Hymenobacter sp.]|uniref:hypothetical protein n=1 Tax=Hymenobacter sp. TaxID=1898978 RepID=UPI002ED9925B
MRKASRLAGAGWAMLAALLTACEGGVEVTFAQPFPAQAADMAAFPARHRAVYTAPDSSRSLCVGRTAVWRQELQSITLDRRQLDSLPRRLTQDSTYQDEKGRLHYVRLVTQDSVRDSWLLQDTIFTLAGPNAGKLRRFQGRYYLNVPKAGDDSWLVQRLEIEGHRLSWQTLGQDTVRLLASEAAPIRYHRAKGISHFRLAPSTPQQTRRVGRYAGLWQTVENYQRRH